jgi:RNA polymerase sigma-70 factor (ECF subfamily)
VNGPRSQDLGRQALDAAFGPYAARQIRFKAHQLVGRYGFTHDDREDLEQELAMDLLRRLPKYDRERASHNTFVARVVDHAVATIIERQKTLRRGHRVPKVSLDAPQYDGEGNETPRSEVLDAAFYLRQTVRSDFRSPEDQDRAISLVDAVRSLPPDLEELCSLCSEYTVSDISRLIGIPRSTLYARLSKIRILFERAGLRHYL